MSDFSEMIQPFENAESLATHIEKALKETVPAGWRAARWPDGSLSWRIEQVDGDSTPGEMVEYSLFATSDLRFIIVTYGNSDAGPLTERHLIHDAKVIQAYGAKRFGLGGYLRDIFENCAPNRTCCT
ncbi:MAG: hypothetical protein GY716_16865 [bacterium]|nr:hypothetical protein [bacterium]